MIKRILLFIAILAVLFPAASSFALVDHKNSGTMYVVEDAYQVTFYGIMGPQLTDSTTNWYTKAMYIGDCNAGHAYVGGVTSNSPASAVKEDVNVFAEYAIFLGAAETWRLGLIASGQCLDQLEAGTVQNDTLDNWGAAGTTETAIHNRLYNAYPWLRLIFDGQTGSGDATVISWWVCFTKKVPGSAYIGSARIKSTTN